MNSSVESEPDVPLVGVAGWFLFLWAVSQVFPAAWRAPWSFNGWFSPVLSLASWLVGGFATTGIVMMFVNQERKPLFMMPLELLGVMAGWGLVFLAPVASLHFVSNPSLPAHASAMAAEPLKSELEKLQGRQVKLGILISELEAERSAIVGRIRKGSAEAIHTHELLEIDRSLKQLKNEAKDVALTIAKGESLLRKTERQRRLRDAGMDSNDMAALRVEIEEKLCEPQSAGEAIQVDRVIREAVGEIR
jgi:hypothetical protein